MARFRSRGLDFGRDNRRKKADARIILRAFLWVIEIIAVILLAAGLTWSFGYKVTMSGSSMAGTIEDKDELLVNRLRYMITVPDRGDIIVCRQEGSHSYSVKRVVAGPTDRVLIYNGVLYVNGAVYDEAFPEIENAGIADSEITIGPDEYFVIGDNPGSSEDSRFSSVGNLKSDEIIGKCWYRIAPKERSGRLNKEKED